MRMNKPRIHKGVFRSALSLTGLLVATTACSSPRHSTGQRTDNIAKVQMAESPQPLALENNIYPNAGTPEFWGSRFCSVVSRDEINALFGTDGQQFSPDGWGEIDAKYGFTPAYVGQAAATWSQSSCSFFNFGVMTLLTGTDTSTSGFFDREPRFRGQEGLNDYDKTDTTDPTGSTGPTDKCEPQVGVLSSATCDRLRIVSVNGIDTKLFDGFDSTEPEPPDGGPEWNGILLTFAAAPHIVELQVTNPAYRNPAKIAQFAELLTQRLRDLQPSTAIQQNPIVASISELTEVQFCSLLPANTTNQFFKTASKSLFFSKAPVIDSNPESIACSRSLLPRPINTFPLWGSYEKDKRDSVTVIVDEPFCCSEPIAGVDFNGRPSTIACSESNFCTGHVVLAEDRVLKLELRRTEAIDVTVAHQQIVDALTFAIAELERMGAIAPFVKTSESDPRGSRLP
jgi:hypothetical protein